jgi:4-amino-4-deoxy-L-arabinose transferase-like glycosyltransferase
MLQDNPNKQLNLFLILAAALFLPAYLINLGLVQMIRDEAIRALVSFEMIHSGDYITPTISGVPYLKKPPLYNWILSLFFGTTGSYSEVVMRLPVILSIIGFAITIYYFTKKEFDKRIALISALAFATYGRIIFYESLHGLIDVTFSWLTYTFFMISWQLFRKEKFLALFLVAYLITAVSFLLKGLPSLVFTTATLLVLFIQGKKFKMLFNWRHFAGILILILIVGGYYLLYFTRNPIQPGQMWEVLSGEVTRRTIVRFGIWKTMLNLVTYPFENIYHFLPWSFLVLTLLPKGSFRKVRQQPFLWYCLLLFIVNIIPYWTSPEGYPRYILMLVPLAMNIFFVLYFGYRDKNHPVTKWIDALLAVILLIGTFSGIAFLLHPATKDLPGILWVSIMLFLALGIIAWLFWKQARYRLFWMAIGMLVFRIGFDLSIIPSWKPTHPALKIKEIAHEMAAEAAGKPLAIYWNPAYPPDPYFQYRYNNEIFTWYLSVNLWQIIKIETVPVKGQYYLAKPEQLHEMKYTLLKKLEPPLQVPVYLVEFN